MPSRREQVAEVLAAHLWWHTSSTHCSCRWRAPLAQLAVEGYAAHVTDALMPLFEQAVEQARNEALEEAVVELEAAYDTRVPAGIVRRLKSGAPS